MALVTTLSKSSLATLFGLTASDLDDIVKFEVIVDKTTGTANLMRVVRHRDTNGTASQRNIPAKITLT